MARRRKPQLPPGVKEVVLASGAIRYQVQYRVGGRGSRNVKRRFAELERALEHWTAVQGDKDAGRPLDLRPRSGLTLEDAWAAWWDEHVVTLAETTQDNYWRAWKVHLSGELGHVVLPALDVARINRWRIERARAGAGAAATNAALRALSACLGWHASQGIHLSYNPAAPVKPLPESPDLDKREALTPELVERLAAKMERATDRIALYLYAYVGLRFSEIARLRWRDVLDEDGNPRERARVRKSKTRTGVRDPWLPEEVRADLLELWHSLGRPGRELLVCQSERSRPLNRRNWASRVWDPAIEGAGLDYRVPYACRHTAASLYIAAGWSAVDVAGQLGHADAGFTLRIYAQKFEDADERRQVPVDEQIRAGRAEFGHGRVVRLRRRRGA